MGLTFQDTLRKATNSPSGAKLPLCHVASIDTILSYIENRIIQTDEICDVFGEKLNYFFYGRAAFKPKPTDNYESALTLPAAIILDPSACISISTMFPFDTGAYPKYKKSTVARNMNAFRLDNDIGSFERIIEYFWRNHTAYFEANHLGFTRRIDPNCTEIECYSSIVVDTPTSIADERRSSLEITSNAPVRIDESNIIGIVIPRAYRSHNEISRLHAAGVKISSVRYNQENRMGGIAEAACNIVAEWQKQNGWYSP